MSTFPRQADVCLPGLQEIRELDVFTGCLKPNVNELIINTLHHNMSRCTTHKLTVLLFPSKGDDRHCFECPRDEEAPGSHGGDRAPVELSTRQTHHETSCQPGYHLKGLSFQHAERRPDQASDTVYLYSSDIYRLLIHMFIFTSASLCSDFTSLCFNTQIF